jgi:hypothetical protein
MYTIEADHLEVIDAHLKKINKTRFEVFKDIFNSEAYLSRVLNGKQKISGAKIDAISKLPALHDLGFFFNDFADGPFLLIWDRYKAKSNFIEDVVVKGWAENEVPDLEIITMDGYTITMRSGLNEINLKKVIQLAADNPIIKAYAFADHTAVIMF